jgi:hypothetical protein
MQTQSCFPGKSMVKDAPEGHSCRIHYLKGKTLGKCTRLKPNCSQYLKGKTLGKRTRVKKKNNAERDE